MNSILLFGFVLFPYALAGQAAPPCPPRVPTGISLPDLRVDQERTASSYAVAYENFDPDWCSVKESGGLLTGGYHKVVRFDVSTPNYGTADVIIGDPTTCHVNVSGTGYNDGLFEYADCHQHYHFRNYAKYELLDSNKALASNTAKRGFCMLDIERIKTWTGPPRVPSPVYTSCGTNTSTGYQGISFGYTDIYDAKLPGQLFNLDGLRSGNYFIRVTVNPRYCQSKTCKPTDTACKSQNLKLCSDEGVQQTYPCGGSVCCDGQRGAEVDATTGITYCHMLKESDYTNNVIEAPIFVPADADTKGYSKSGSGNLAAPLKTTTTTGTTMDPGTLAKIESYNHRQ